MCMKYFYRSVIVAVVYCLIQLPASVLAGNPDRAGQAGATEILINPWAQSSGWGSVDVGGVHGVEAIFGNVAGTAFTKGTDVAFTHSIWLKGSEMSINAA